VARWQLLLLLLPLLPPLRPWWGSGSWARCSAGPWELWRVAAAAVVPWRGVVPVGPKSWASRRPRLWRALHSPQLGSGEGERWGGGGWSSIWPVILEPEWEKLLWPGEKQLGSDWGPGTKQASQPAPTPLLLPSPRRRPGRLMVLSKTISFSLLELSINIDLKTILHEYVYSLGILTSHMYTYTYTTLNLYN
jgi:hypothetical protein